MKMAIYLAFAATACSSQPANNASESLEEFSERLRNHPAPSVSAVAALEQGLAKIECVGPLDQWQRQYAFSVRTTTVDETVIDFELKQAGRAGITSSLIRTHPGAFLGNDDTPTKMAAGQYDTRSGKITLDFCGENVG